MCRIWRLARLLLLLLAGLLVTLTLFPLCPQGRRLALRQSWSAAVLGVLAIRLDARAAEPVAGSLLVANHISWLDIFVINAVQPSAFVSKSEVRQWPLIGWLAAMNDTIFLQRGSRGHARVINAQVAARLGDGQTVAVFPEGTTTDGRSLLHFHAALIQPALLAGRPVRPVALSYWTPSGERSLAPRYDGDITLGACLLALLRCPALVARMDIGPVVSAPERGRREVAEAAREFIAAAAGLPRVSTAPGTGDDPPA